MRTQLIVILLILLVSCSKKEQVKPNFVLILADDMGYSDIGCYGGEINTPNIDKLAAEGLKMTHFYNAARCCPSRASLLTGLYPHQTGVGHMMFDDSIPGYRGFLNKNCVTIAELLGEAGYQCMIAGKWHVGYPEHAWPMKRGFHKQYPGNGTTGHYFGVAEGRDFIIEDTLRDVSGDWVEAGKIRYKPLKNDDGSQWYATDAFTDRAIQYIDELRDQSSEQPFFLYLPYTAPHWPLHAFEEDIQKYLGTYLLGWDSLRRERYQRMLELGIINPDWELSPLNENTLNWDNLDDSTKAYYDRLMAVYAAMIDRMDQNIGKLIQKLEQTGDIDHTVIMFLSDNGGCHEAPHKGKPGALPGHPDFYDGYEYSWANASNTPFRWFKHWTHEGGSSTPFIAWYPKLIQPGTVDHQVAQIMDIMPTILDLAEVQYPLSFQGNSIFPLEGISLLPLFKGQSLTTDRTLFWEHEGNKAVRQGDWKLVCRYDYKFMKQYDWELYNLKTDRTELHNLAGELPEKVEEMKLQWFEWAKEVGVEDYAILKSKRPW